MPVRVEVNLGELHGDQQTTVNLIQAALERRLSRRDEIPVSPQGATVFRLKFAETAEIHCPFMNDSRCSIFGDATRAEQ